MFLFAGYDFEVAETDNDEVYDVDTVRDETLETDVSDSDSVHSGPHYRRPSE